MFNVSVKLYTLFILNAFVSSNFTIDQTVDLAPKSFFFSWQKANGDQYEIPVENNLNVQIQQQRVNRVLMQVLLKSVLKSRDFEGFNPVEFTLYSETEYHVTKIEFTIFGASDQLQKYAYYFNFDTYGNVFSR